MGWIRDIRKSSERSWEGFYRHRWQHDRVVRSTHGVNCTGGCSWAVYVKDGIITWELQQTDYPVFDPDLPPYEPRGCQRGISASWYVYSPLRVKYPYIRGALLDAWREARRRRDDPVEAWASIVSDDEKRARWQRARGKGGFRRASWDEALEIVAASCIYTARRWGPDRIFGFSPIPGMSYLSYAGGARFLQLIGGVAMSFYDWYADLPNAFPEVWGDQTDVAESADWCNATYIVTMGSNVNMTRTPDAHFLSEARARGAKVTVFSPDFSQVSKSADWWIPLRAGSDTALWMAVNHVIFKEFHADREVPFFRDYLLRTTDAPFLVELHEGEDGVLRPGRFLRASSLERYRGEEHAEWKLCVWDRASGQPRAPAGTVGFRWGKLKGRWNLRMEDGVDGTALEPLLTMLDEHDEVVQVGFRDYEGRRTLRRGVPVRRLRNSDGEVLVTTVFDLLAAQLGVSRGLPGAYPNDYDDAEIPFTPAWQERYTGIGRDTVVRFAREFAGNAERTNGRSMIIIGAGINHWYNNNLAYRAPITALLLCACPGRNGGGLNHYVGQEKVTLLAPWGMLAFALDWGGPPRRQQSSIWHYVHSDQWRYEGPFTEYATVPEGARHARGHAVDLVAKSVRLGWMPFYPQFDANPAEIVRRARDEGASDDAAVVRWLVERLKEGKVRFSVEDPDAPENWPRVWIIWRGNAIASSAKGHEYFLRHYLGTHDAATAEEAAKGAVETVRFREPAPRGKMDLVVDLNFRMDSSALYSDIVLPAAFWYEKDDINTTDLHSFVHPLRAAAPPAWESKTDWEIFKALARKVGELARARGMEPFEEVVAWPLTHDTPDELAQTDVRDWRAGECEAVPGRTMPHLKVVTRDYRTVYERFVSFGPLARANGVAANGVHVSIADEYDAIVETASADTPPDPRRVRVVEWGGKRYPSVEDALDAANLLLRFAPETNGELAYRAFREEEERTGVELADLAAGNRGVRMTMADITKQVRRALTSPVWTGIMEGGRAYAAWTLNVERQVPWRTLSGRQHFYVDHQWYRDFGEELPTYKPKLVPGAVRDLAAGEDGRDGVLVLNYITPHGKWNIHSTYKDNLRMLTLSRGMEPLWLNDRDAERAGIRDNDWVELVNVNGVVVTRAAVSARIQPGTCYYYHAVERTVFIPKGTHGRRAGGHNSLTRTRVNPVLLAGGQAQFTYNFNYWGPIGINRDTACVVRKLDRVEW